MFNSLIYNFEAPSEKGINDKESEKVINTKVYSEHLRSIAKFFTNNYYFDTSLVTLLS